MARRLAPPSSLPQGTAIQALDTGSRQWLDATVQGTSPAGTCLRVSFVDAGPCVLVRQGSRGLPLECGVERGGWLMPAVCVLTGCIRKLVFCQLCATEPVCFRGKMCNRGHRGGSCLCSCRSWGPKDRGREMTGGNMDNF